MCRQRLIENQWFHFCRKRINITISNWITFEQTILKYGMIPVENVRCSWDDFIEWAQLANVSFSKCICPWLFAWHVFVLLFQEWSCRYNNSCSTIVSNTKNENYMNVWQPTLHPSQNRKPSNLQCLDSAPSRPYEG